MEIALDLLTHNAWANRTVLDSLAGAPRVLASVAYDSEPLSARTQHFLGTERAFLDILRGDPRRPAVPSGIEAMIAYATETAAGLASVINDAARPEGYHVPWFRTSLSRDVILIQVAGHSAQHRSELAWELARAGVNTGELDFIIWTVAGRPAPGEPLRLQGA